MSRFFLMTVIFVHFSIVLGCNFTPTDEQLGYGNASDVGGGDINGATTVHMPFPAETSWLCTQGAGGDYSHGYNSTRFDLDFDTPNPPMQAAELFAPQYGVARVHMGSSGFGNHINIDMSDGTYILLGHMSEVWVEDGEFVVAGRLLGLAGCTGACTGDHVHFGLHRGDAGRNANEGESVPFNVLAVDYTMSATPRPYRSEDFVCGLTGGRYYESVLPVSWGELDDDDVSDDDDMTPPSDDDDATSPQSDDDDAEEVDQYEGDETGECSDGADNDRDGWFDCTDQGCFGSPSCSEGDDDDVVPSDDDDMTPPSDDDDATSPPSDDDDATQSGPIPHELCWQPTGLVSPRAGELWVQTGGWQTIASNAGAFSVLCGTVQASSGDALIVNGEYSANNVLADPWWICANWGSAGMVIHGEFFVDGIQPATYVTSNGVGGCDVRLFVP
jgi:hypothetical protein